MRVIWIEPCFLTVVVAIGGCASVTTTVEVAPAAAPVALVEQLPLTLGVQFSDEFRKAQPEAGVLPGKQYTPEWRFQITSALESTFRQVLGKQFVRVIDVDEFPTQGSKALKADAVMVPTVPEVLSPFYFGDSLFNTTLIIVTCRVDLCRPSGELLAQWIVSGTVSDRSATAIGAHQDLLRSFAASLIHSLYREPALGALRSVGMREESGETVLDSSAAPLNVISMRLDARRPRGDSIEEQFSNCLDTYSSGGHASETIDAPRLRDETFPWLEPWQLSEGRSATNRVLRLPLLQTKLRSLGIGYLILYKVSKHRSGDHAGGCIGGYGGAACLGYGETTTAYSVDGELWDVSAVRVIDVLDFSTSRTFGAVVLLVVPIPYGTAGQSKSCDELKKQIRDSIEASRIGGAPPR